MGLPNIADIPAVAPDASNILRSYELMRVNCPSVDPNAPPVAMMGPSDPNGPPVPIDMADDIGLRYVIDGLILLLFVNICSIASGMPWPLMAFEP